MSAIAAVVQREGSAAAHRVERLVAGGARAPIVIAAGGAAIATDGTASIASAHALAAAVDGSIYYRRALLPRLSPRWRERIAAAGGVDAVGAAELVLGLYDAGGDDALAALDGDFAFVLWDASAARLVCGRDFIGFHALHVVAHADATVVASRARDLRAHGEAPRALDVESIVATIAGLLNVRAGVGTAGVRELWPGELLVHERERLTTRALWTIPEPDAAVARLSFDDAAMELRARLQRAVIERMAPHGDSSLWLSGGWDSSALLASGACAIDAGAAPGRDLVPISMSYPVGDPGREDELIADATAALRRTPRWCLIDDVPLLPPHARPERDGVFGHAFEEWNRAMARATRATPTRVAMIGMGGDELFSGTTIYLADLLRRGRLGALAREWYRERGRTLHRFPELVLRPAATRVLAGAGLGSPWRLWCEGAVPAWVSRDAIESHGLVERERAAAPATPGDLADAEVAWLLDGAMFTRIRTSLGDIVADEGVVLRAPMFDRAVVAFARARPRRDRVAGGETKRLLRHAMRGLLPDSFLAPRTHRTGVSGAYLVEGMRRHHREAIAERFAAPVLAELGLVDQPTLASAWDRFCRDGGSMTALSLYQTYAAELWVREQLGVDDATRRCSGLSPSRHSVSDPHRAPLQLSATPAENPAGRRAQLQ